GERRGGDRGASGAGPPGAWRRRSGAPVGCAAARGSLMPPRARAGRVHLVGAGPGDPGLLTLRAAECLAKADVVISDALVPEAILRSVRPGAEVIHPDRSGRL